MVRFSGMTGVVVAAALAILLSAPTAFAAKPAPDPDTTQYVAALDLIDQLQVQGASQDEIDAALQAQFGWIPVPLQPAIAPLNTSASFVTIGKPSVSWDQYAQRYQVYVTWQWRLCDFDGQSLPCWINDGVGGNMGGLDGFGVQVSRSVPPILTFMQSYSQNGTRTLYTTPSAHNNYGATFDEQDMVTNGQYNWHRGEIIWAFGAPSCSKGQYWTFNAKMAHTWSSTQLTSFSVGTSGITATFSSTSNRWFGAGPQPLNWYPCGQ